MLNTIQSVFLSVTHVFMSIYTLPLLGPTFEFSKNSPNWLKFGVMGFFDMGNMNLKEFFDFDHEKATLRGVYCLKNVVFPESGSGKHFHDSAMRAIDSPRLEKP
jgi:hypothetical protein